MKDLLSVFTESFGIQVAAIALAVATADLLLNKFREKLPPYIVNYSPLLVAIIAAIICGAITEGEFLTRSTISAGVISYSMGIAVSATAKRIFRGEKVDGALIILISEITAAICKDDVATEITTLLLNLKNSAENDADVSDKIANVLTAHAKDGVSKKEILAAVQLILLSTENFRNSD